MPTISQETQSAHLLADCGPKRKSSLDLGLAYSMPCDTRIERTSAWFSGAFTNLPLFFFLFLFFYFASAFSSSRHLSQDRGARIRPSKALKVGFILRRKFHDNPGQCDIHATSITTFLPRTESDCPARFFRHFAFPGVEKWRRVFAMCTNACLPD